MTKRKISELEAFDAADYLGGEEARGVYLSEILKQGDTALFLSALGDVAKARGMAEIAAKSGLGRESLYKAFAAGRKPQFETVHKVIKALEMHLEFVPRRHRHGVWPAPPDRSDAQ